MKSSGSVRSVGYLKNHAAEVVRDVSENNGTILITHRGQAKAVLQNVTDYEQTQDSLTLLKLLMLSTESLAEHRYKSVKKAFTDIRRRTTTQSS